ncbi:MULTISPECIES: type VI secretion system ATPase TssH [Proteus]|uniref:type VI secretion system ATPase TssH n=1 Tax=Proteus TaxID=583 RepID=UPI000D1AD64B|nr:MULTISPECIES: type VI secretion system ATPase TssH [Proteus]EKV9967534.1 type VI secretion system ATPase TssH [Proteus mirabilis]EKV9970799.1 type VI secretion system ATPase TssH [Proteus mirabilis]ELA6761251.1 type VI secretion system ATPase TssH [Proteus mirabilis]ELA6763983.1 type VI secretion system ATPase TssH [Proteus mirabilis]EMB4672933.1 type VI secretion system ATPase TssH [Proteus mirabilis]
MIQIDLSTLVNRLHPIAKHALESAAAYCVSHQQPEITIAQFLQKLIETPLTDIRMISQKSALDINALSELLDIDIPPHQVITQSYPSFSPLLVEWMKDSWLLASTELNHSELRSGALFLTLLQMPLRYLAKPVADMLAQINRDQLKLNFDQWTEGSAESPFDEKTVSEKGNLAADSLLAKFTHNMTEQARNGELDPVLCRDNEIDLMIDILCRRRKNNPVVVGEPGVGKSALIEGLALRIIAGDIPDKLRGCELLTLDLGALQAGAAVKGEFEKRFKGIMQEVTQSPHPIILFIDEAHTLIGAGNQQGGLDVSNLLKPALARGELRTIAATTWSEYKKYFEKDAALARRFQLVQVKEPSSAEAIIIMRGLRSIYEKSHHVFIDDEALRASAELSERYISGRQLPDKAIDVLDTACARAAINLSSPPKALSSLKTELHQINMEMDVLQREHYLGLDDHSERLETLASQASAIEQQATDLQQAWEQQKELVSQIITLRATLLNNATEATNDDVANDVANNEEVSDIRTYSEAEDAEDNAEDNDEKIATQPPCSSEELKQQLQQLDKQLAQLHDTHLLVSPHVDKKQIAAVIAEWTGVPLNRLSQDALSIVTELPTYLEESIKGQSLAIQCLHKHLLTARADLRRPGRPLGAFLLAGPSGVGKTETVIQIAQLMFGGTQYLTTINMSEFQEKHTVSRLIGSPPGYVGYGEGGILTEAIRKRPYSVVLLDEVEKAHPDVLNLFYQAFDKGEIADGEGRVIDCKNIAFFLTSNLGDHVITAYADKPDELEDALYPELTTFFKPALLARMEVIPYLPLPAEVLRQIVDGKLARLINLLKQRFNAEINVEESVATEILRRASRAENGARILESIIDGALLPPLSLLLLQYSARNEAISHIRLATENDEFIAEVN